MAIEHPIKMKLKLVLLLPILFSQLPAHSQQTGYYSECYSNVEEYLPGYHTPDGTYVSGHVRRDRRVVPCGGNGYSSYPSYNNYPSSNNGYQNTSTRSIPRCDRNNTIFNGLLGGGIAAAFSKPDAYKWSVPLGAALGISSSRIGCR